jgi:hypothetical protein
MKALTIWQPWASLVMIRAKRLEFRKWDYRKREPKLEGQRIVIHAGSRPIRVQEVLDLKTELLEDRSSLIRELALPLLDRLLEADRCQGVIELSAGLGTVVIGRPRRVDALFKAPDSDRIDHHMFAWPVSDPRPFPEPRPMSGLQGFWNWPERIAA